MGIFSPSPPNRQKLKFTPVVKEMAPAATIYIERPESRPWTGRKEGGGMDGPKAIWGPWRRGKALRGKARLAETKQGWQRENKVGSGKTRLPAPKQGW